MKLVNTAVALLSLSAAMPTYSALAKTGKGPSSHAGQGSQGGAAPSQSSKAAAKNLASASAKFTYNGTYTGQLHDKFLGNTLTISGTKITVTLDGKKQTFTATKLLGFLQVDSAKYHFFLSVTPDSLEHDKPPARDSAIDVTGQTGAKTFDATMTK